MDHLEGYDITKSVLFLKVSKSLVVYGRIRQSVNANNSNHMEKTTEGGQNDKNII